MSSVGFDEKSVFNAAREIADAAARDDSLQVACAGDPAALERIRELLRAHAEEPSFLESPAVASAAPAPPSRVQKRRALRRDAHRQCGRSLERR